jgi:putative GTP pyrophosphokinase
VSAPSRTQIDKLGHRFKRGEASEDDLRALDDYRRSFSDAYDQVVASIKSRIGLEITGRPAKSTASIIDKLRRESVRLTQIQDIAGCRLVVGDRAAQNAVVLQLASIFPLSAVVDRRENPSHSYRAVHVVVSFGGKAVEIQTRTILQQKWAELSEKLSDVVDPAIKYGGGAAAVRNLLSERSNTIAEIEMIETALLGLDNRQERDQLLNRINGLKSAINADLSSMVASPESFQADDSAQ